MGNKYSETIKDGNDAHNYFLKTTSRSVVIEFHNLTAADFRLQDSLIIHGDNLLQELQETIRKDTFHYICHGSNGIMTGVQGWASYISSGGITMKILWECDYIGISMVTIDVNNYMFTKTEFEDSTKNNIHIKLELKNIEF